MGLRRISVQLFGRQVCPSERIGQSSGVLKCCGLNLKEAKTLNHAKISKSRWADVGGHQNAVANQCVRKIICAGIRRVAQAFFERDE